MTDTTPPVAPAEAPETTPAAAPVADPAANEAAEAGDALADLRAKAAAADVAAQAAGFADAAAKAEFEAAAAKPKPRRQRAPRTAKPKDGGFRVKAPDVEQFATFVSMAANGGMAQFVLSDGRKPIEGVRPATSAVMLRRGRPVNAAAIAFAGAGLDRPVSVTHVFAVEDEQLLAITELAAPVHIGVGEQFRIDAGALAFFPPVAPAAAD